MDNMPVRESHPTYAGRGTKRVDQNHDAKSKVIGIKSRVKLIARVAVIVIVIVGFIVGAWFLFQSSTSSSIDSSKYQGVFLTNGQVYFGKLRTLNGGYMKLTDIYYLQTESKESSSLQDSTDSASNVKIIKLGSEIHGPSDEMIINKDQILFFENLKKDGQVSDAILKYQKEQSSKK